MNGLGRAITVNLLEVTSLRMHVIIGILGSFFGTVGGVSD